jgi:hypothetical protein
LNPIPHEAQLQDQKQRKAQEGHLEEGKAARLTKGTKRGKKAKMAKKSSKTQKSHKTQKLPLNQILPNTLNASSPPSLDIIMFLLSTTRLARVLLALCTISPPL